MTAAESRRQPYVYTRRPLIEPDWRRLPGYRDVTVAEWEDARWQRRHTITELGALARVFGPHLPESLRNSIEQDQQRFATMSMRVTPHVLNTMDEQDLWADPVRRYVLPAAADRDPVWHTHPWTRRDNLREKEMFAVEGLVWRYPTKALVELADTCPVYCGHCTRLDLVGPDVPSVSKHRMTGRASERFEAMLRYVEATPSIRDVVLSGGDLANVEPSTLERVVLRLMATGHVRAIRLATKGLIVLPQHFLQESVLRAFERMGRAARDARVDLAVHTHANHRRSLTPLVTDAVSRLLDAGVRAVRNQAVLMRGINDSSEQILDLCFALADEVQATPYYLFMGDLIPNGEHWRTPLHVAQAIQDDILGYLSGFATPRVSVDVPYVGKRLVHQASSYDRVRGISTWTKNYRTPLDCPDGELREQTFIYVDPVFSLPDEGRAYWESLSRELDAGRIHEQVFADVAARAAGGPSSRAGAETTPGVVRVGFTYNQKRVKPGLHGEHDEEAEYESPELLDAIRGAIRELGHEAIDLEATRDLPGRLMTARVDVVFNLAEGVRGRGREAHVPSMLEWLGIPFTGTDAVGMALTLDKALAKQVVAGAGVPVPPGVVLESIESRVEAGALRFPAIVKPLAEGSSKGVLGSSVVHDLETLHAVAAATIRKYRGPVLVEEFLSGREFSVGILGYPVPEVLPVMEMRFLAAAGAFPVYGFENKQHSNDAMRFECPADLDDDRTRELGALALSAYRALGCRDLARLDFRMDGHGRLHFIECNPLPGLTPDWSDFAVMGKTAGLDFTSLIGEILAGALRRRER